MELYNEISNKIINKKASNKVKDSGDNATQQYQYRQLKAEDFKGLVAATSHGKHRMDFIFPESKWEGNDQNKN